MLILRSNSICTYFLCFCNTIHQICDVNQIYGSVTIDVAKVSIDFLTGCHYIQKLRCIRQINASVTVDGAAESYPAGSVRASVPARAADALTAWSLAEDGAISAVGGAWDAQQQTYTFDVVSGVTAIARFPFTDVPAGSWYYGAAAYASTNGLFAAPSPTT